MKEKFGVREADTNPVGSGFPLSAALTSAAVAVISTIFGAAWADQAFVARSVALVSILVPELHVATRVAVNPEHAGFLLATQWAFVPVYMLIWFKRESPWGASVRRRLLAVTQHISLSRRMIGLATLFLGLACWVSTNVGVEIFPTFYSGTLFYPDEPFAPNLLLNATRSSIGMAIVAWFSPIAEVVVTWMFLVCICNFSFVWKAYRVEQ